MKMYYVYSLVILSVILVSCGQSTKETGDNPREKGIFDAIVTHSAGDRWSFSDEFLPLPMNIANVNEKQVLIMSDRLDVNVNIKVKPLGSIKIIENDTLNTYVLAIPNNEDKITLNAEGFDEFSTVHSSAKWIVEQYLLNRKGGYATQLKSWENEKSAINYLLN